jgi:hypothetical protein
MFTVPMFFGVISASTLNARAGSRNEISITGVNPWGAALTTEIWIVERRNVNRPLRFTYIPYTRVKDKVVPSLGAFGTLLGGATNFVITVSDVDTTESLQVVSPGLDSQELRRFLRSWKIPF